MAQEYSSVSLHKKKSVALHWSPNRLVKSIASKQGYHTGTVCACECIRPHTPDEYGTELMASGEDRGMLPTGGWKEKVHVLTHIQKQTHAHSCCGGCWWYAEAETHVCVCMCVCERAAAASSSCSGDVDVPCSSSPSVSRLWWSGADGATHRQMFPSFSCCALPNSELNNNTLCKHEVGCVCLASRYQASSKVPTRHPHGIA